MKKLLLIIIVLSFIACNHDNDDRQPWPGGQIPFVMIGFTPEEEFEIFKSMLTWELASGGKVEFFIVGARETENKPLYISKGEDSMSIGHGYDPQGGNFVVFNSTFQQTILHELGHSLGLMHEMTRPDRDLFITVDIDSSVCPLYKYQFIPVEPKLYDFRKYPFDYNSIMMYGEYPAYGIHIDGHGHTLGSESISIIDALKVRDIYAE